MKRSNLLILAHFGRFPAAFDLTLESCAQNPDVRWLIVTDQIKQPGIAPNIRWITMSLEEFAHLAGSRLGFPIQITNPYKICDLRPAFGEIFSEFLSNADFWGHWDADVIFGRISHFLRPELMENFDVISTLDFRLNGPFTLFRNTQAVNTAFRRHEQFQHIMQDASRFHLFDEFLMTPVLQQLEQQGSIRCYFDSTLMQAHELQSGLFYWHQGTLKEALSGRESMFFHYGSWKSSWERGSRESPRPQGRSWVLMKEGLFEIPSEDRSPGLKKDYEKFVQGDRHTIQIVFSPIERIVRKARWIRKQLASGRPS